MGTNKTSQVPAFQNKNRRPSKSTAKEPVGEQGEEPALHYVFELARAKKALPTKIEDLIPLSYLGEAAAKFYRTKIQALKDLRIANAQVDATYQDALEAAVLLFHIYERLGNLVDQHTASPFESGRAGGKGVLAENTLFSSISKLAKAYDIGRKRLEDAKTIAMNPQYIPTVVEEARKRQALPSRSRLVSVIRAGNPGRTGKHKTSQGASKHERLTVANKRLASSTNARECSNALRIANSFMPAVIQQWKSIPEPEKSDLKAELIAMQDHLDQLSSSQSGE
jgi:hypothetical protein